jgi:hypothetical protein
MLLCWAGGRRTRTWREQRVAKSTQTPSLRLRVPQNSFCSAKPPGSVCGANGVSSTKKKHAIPPTMTPIRNAAVTTTAVSIWSELHYLAEPRRRSAPGARSTLACRCLGVVVLGWTLEYDTLFVAHGPFHALLLSVEAIDRGAPAIAQSVPPVAWCRARPWLGDRSLSGNANPPVTTIRSPRNSGRHTTLASFTQCGSYSAIAKCHPQLTGVSVLPH